MLIVVRNDFRPKLRTCDVRILQLQAPVLSRSTVCVRTGAPDAPSVKRGMSLR